MNEQHHGNLLGGAIGETTQAAAQIATILATAAQTALRLQTRRFDADRALDLAADVPRVELRREHAAARHAWTPAFERPFAVASPAEAGPPPSHGSNATRQLGKPPASPKNASASCTPS